MDYGIMVFADQRYTSAEKRSKMPGWITQYLLQENMNLSTDRAVQTARAFLKQVCGLFRSLSPFCQKFFIAQLQMAQPLKQEDLLGTAMLSSEHLAKLQSQGFDGNAEQGQTDSGKQVMDF